VQDYFFFGAESGPLRFTRTRETFCIIALERPKNGRVIIDTPIPILGNDTIGLLGAGEEGSQLKWSQHGGYSTVIEVPDNLLNKVIYKIRLQSSAEQVDLTMFCLTYRCSMPGLSR